MTFTAIHGKHGTTEYKVWVHLRGRCLSPTNKDYIYYGGRGIGVCPRWNNFSNFLEDMGERPSDKHTIDRIDNKKDYSPENCRWATMEQQSRNKRNIYYVKTSKRFLSFVDVFSGATLRKYPRGPRNLSLFRKMKKAKLIYKCNQQGDLCLVS